MSHAHSNRHNYVDDDQEDDLGEFDQDSGSFEGGNEIFELRSQVNSLKIEKQKLIIEHQSAMASIQSRNQQLTQANNQLRRDNTSLNSKLQTSEEEYDELKKNYDSLRQHFESISRKTADFHRSVDDKHSNLGDPSDIINDLLEKDKVIEQLTKQLQSYKSQQDPKNSKQVHQQIQQEQRQKFQTEIKSLKQTIDDLKRKQITYKREYEGMLQSKEQIIKKMASQNQDYSKKIIQSKDKIINELRRQLQESLKRNDDIKQQNKSMSQKLVTIEGQCNKLKVDFRRKQQRLMQSKQVEKGDLTKQMNEKLKKYLIEKQEKLSKSQDKVYDLENQILLLKQQLGKQKAQIASREQFTSYLETSNRQYEESKKKLQNLLYQRQKQLGDLRQTYYSEVSELKKSMIQERAALDQKICELEEQVVIHRMQSDKYQEELKQYDRNDNQERNKYSLLNSKQCDKLRREKDDLNQELLVLQDRYKQKSEKMLNLQKKIRKQYEERISNLQSELIKERERVREQKQQQINDKINKKSNIETEFEKMKNVLELVQIDKAQLEAQLKRAKQEKISADKEKMDSNTKVRDIQRKLKEKQEDYRYLEISYDQLKEKYRKGVKDLQDQISEMTKQFQEQRRKAERRKNQSQDSQSSMSVQIKNYKQRISELQTQLDNIKTNKIEDAQYTDLKLQKLANQLAIITKQKDAALKMNGRLSKDKEQVYQAEKQKLMEYISQLQENNEILNKKLDMTEIKDRSHISGFEKQLRSLKIEYSESLKQTNILLQKYKKLQEVHQQTLSQMDYIRADHDKLNKKYLEIYREKNKLCDELNSSYDQINKLNMVLMSKEEQISRTKAVHCPHFQPKPVYSSTRQMYNPSLNSQRSRSPLQKADSSFMYRKSNPYN